MAISHKIEEFAEAIKETVKMSDDVSNIEFEGNPFIDNIEKFGNNITKDDVERVEQYHSDFNSASTKAFIDVAHERAIGNSEVNEFNTTFSKMDKDSLSMQLHVTKEFRVPGSDRKVEKFGHTQVTSTHHAEKGSAGDMKKVFEYGSELFESLVKRTEK